MTDKPDILSNLLEKKLIARIHQTYDSALSKWMRDNAGAFMELKDVKDTDPYFKEKRLAIIGKYGLARSLALVLVRAGHSSIPLITKTMTQIEDANGEADKFGVSAE